MKNKHTYFRYNIVNKNGKNYIKIEVGYILSFKKQTSNYAYILLKDSKTKKQHIIKYDLEDIQIENNPFKIKIASNIFTEDSIKLNIKNSVIDIKGMIQIKNIDKVNNDSFWQYKVFCLNAIANGEIFVEGEQIKFRYANLHLDGIVKTEYLDNKIYASSNNIQDLKEKYAKSAVCLYIANGIFQRKIFSCIMLNDSKYLFTNKRGAFVESIKEYTRGKEKITDIILKQKNIILNFRVKSSKIIVAMYSTKLKNKEKLIFKGKFTLPYVVFN